MDSQHSDECLSGSSSAVWIGSPQAREPEEQTHSFLKPLLKVRTDGWVTHKHKRVCVCLSWMCVTPLLNDCWGVYNDRDSVLRQSRKEDREGGDIQ